MSIESDPLQGSLQHEIIAQVGEMFAVRTDSRDDQMDDKYFAYESFSYRPLEHITTQQMAW